jgi:hypothetical protein
VALSCAVRLAAADSWVLAATITTDPTLGLNSLTYPGYKAILLAPRDTDPPRPGAPPRPPEYVIMVHPAFTKGEPSVTYSPGCGGLIPPPDGKPELRATTSGPPLSMCDNDIDPVAEHGHPEFGVRWLTGSARVANTELVVLVQQKYDDAVAPHQGHFLLFVVWVGGVAAIGFVSFAVLRWLASRGARARKSPAD